ncbi:MAG: TatD family nuclease-associated radical SAM protein [Acidiferrobacteraceae bacterium]|jgi:TatD family-associated radical SAM protein
MDERNTSVTEFAFTQDGVRYLQITQRSNLECRFWPAKFSQLLEKRGGRPLPREPSVNEILYAIGDPASWRDIVFGGPGEPTLRLYDFLEVARRVRERGGHVSLETDGLANVVYQRDITPDLEGSVDQLAVFLNVHDQATYDRYFQCGFADPHSAALEFARSARAFVPKLTLVAMEGVGDVDKAACQQIADDLGVEFAAVVYGPAPSH